MEFYDYKEDIGKYYPNPYNTTATTITCDYNFDSAPVQTSSRYSSPYESVEPELVDYKSSASEFPSELSYSAYAYSDPEIHQYKPTDHRTFFNYYESSEVNFYCDPKLLQHEPTSYGSKLTVSRSIAEFSEPEFEEYDPTPYSGGYDPVETYGKPIPPSDITCYPRSVPKSDSTPLENFSYASIPSPYGRDDDLPIETPNGNTPVDTEADSIRNDDKVTSDGVDVEIADEREKNEFGNGKMEDYGCESSEKEVPQMPYGAGLEAMDLCESLFGYWPCLAKRGAHEQSKSCQFCGQDRTMDPWKSVADYLFGSPSVYENYHHHHHHQQQQVQYEFYENSWLQ